MSYLKNWFNFLKGSGMLSEYKDYSEYRKKVFRITKEKEPPEVDEFRLTLPEKERVDYDYMFGTPEENVSTQKLKTKARWKDYLKRKHILTGWKRKVDGMRRWGTPLSDCPRPPIEFPKSKKWSTAKEKVIKGKKFAKFLREQGLDNKAWRNYGSGSTTYKSDVVNKLDYNFEVKVGKHFSLPQALKQTQRDAEMAHSKPSISFHLDGMRDDEWWIIIDAYEWAELMKKSKEPVVKQPDREFKWKLERVRQAIKELENYLPQ